MVSLAALGKVSKQVEGSDPFPLFSTGEATPEVLGPVLGSGACRR